MQANAIQKSRLDDIYRNLPLLPKKIRYYDDFDDRLITIKSFDTLNILTLDAYGGKRTIDFRIFGQANHLIKHLVVFLISKDLQASTVLGLIRALKRLDSGLITDFIYSKSGKISIQWNKFLARDDFTIDTYSGLKSLLVFCCHNNIDSWNVDYLDFISKSLPLPSRDKYRSIRSGNAFISDDQEAKIVNYFNNVSHDCENSSYIDFHEIRATSALMLAYTFGVRPIQIALLTISDMKIFEADSNEDVSVHLTFHIVKQKSKAKALRFTRRIKREWVPIITKLYFYMDEIGKSGADRLLGAKSPREVGVMIAELGEKITSIKLNATQLRHSAAQRLVDAGASQEELAEFLGHADITTGLVYFDTSANQAELINKALGLSEVFNEVQSIAKNKYINSSELSQLKGEQQIAGVPHGIPIAGIGGCESGQPTCPYNPVTSCYGCHKFMPINDISQHQSVLKGMRDTVKLFSTKSLNDQNSPVYLQLKRTITNIQLIIRELENDHA